jgi:hypothetical protein
MTQALYAHMNNKTIKKIKIRTFKKKKVSVVVHTCRSSTQEAKAGGP